MAERAVPPRVVAAERIAAEAAFKKSCIPQVGRLLSLAAASKPCGTIAESGTGSGVGTAWLHSGLGAGARLVTVERDENLARRAAGVFVDDKRVSILTGDWRLLEQHAPFDVFFCDGGGKRDAPSGLSNSSPPGAFSSWMTSRPRPTGRLATAARWMSSESSTSPIPPFTPPRYSPHRPAQRLSRHDVPSRTARSGPSDSGNKGGPSARRIPFSLRMRARSRRRASRTSGRRAAALRRRRWAIASGRGRHLHRLPVAHRSTAVVGVRPPYRARLTGCDST